jgi:taurine dioxygenase
MSEASYSRIKVEPTSPALGAEISGVDLSRGIDDETFAEIQRAWLEHAVIFFREQRLAPAEQMAFAERFGELGVYPFMEPLPDFPHVIPIIKEKDTKFNFGGGWHSDMSYAEKPPKATCLYAIETPAYGGDTLFASMTAAYEALSPGLQALLDGVQAVFTASKVHSAAGFYGNADHPMSMKSDEDQAEQRWLHPVVRTHDETGKQAIYCDAPHVERLENMRVGESDVLVDYLNEFATQESLTTRFRWRPGSLALWDNRCVMHYALNDYAGQRREMNRITIQGDKPA